MTAGHTAPGAQRARQMNLSAELPLLWPATGFVSQNFDASRHHYGIDIAAKIGYSGATRRQMDSWCLQGGPTKTETCW